MRGHNFVILILAFISKWPDPDSRARKIQIRDTSERCWRPVSNTGSATQVSNAGSATKVSNAGAL